METALLFTGKRIPLVGLGTWQAKPEEIEASVEVALDAGYRLIDTAFNYNNEEAIGKSIMKWIDSGKGTREDLFIVTKLPHIGNRSSDVSKYIRKSLDRLQLKKIDLYLVHMPFGFIPNSTGEAPELDIEGNNVIDFDTDHIAVWKAMEEQVADGKTDAIGLSNFNKSQMEHIILNAQIQPACLQIELHANMQQRDLREFCSLHNIAVMAYSPLASPGSKSHFLSKYNYSPEKFPDLLGHPTVIKIADRHKKVPAQILLRHLVQQGIIVIPKSCNKQRIQQNIEISDFKLGDEEMQELNNLDCGEDGRFLDFRFFKGIEKHPQYPFERGSFQKQINKIFEDSKLNFDNVENTTNNEISCCKVESV